MHGTDVLYKNSYVCRNSISGNFFVGQYLNELLLAPRRVLGWNNTYHQIFCRCCHLQRFDGFWLVVFDADNGKFRFENVFDNLNAFDNFFRVFLHQTIVGCDVWLTLCCIDDEYLCFCQTRLNFLGGREARTTHSGNTGIANNFNERVGCFFLEVRDRVLFNPFFFAIRLNNDGKLG